MTAAAVQALSLVPNAADISEALGRAGDYLRQIQTAGFTDPFSASWAMQALSLLGTQDGSAYLANVQTGDGGVSTTLATMNNRVWATSYAIPAALGKSWNTILASFSPPQPAAQQSASENNNSGGTDSDASVGAGGFSIPPQPEELATSTASTSTPSVVLIPSSTPTLIFVPEVISPPELTPPEPQPAAAIITVAPTPTTTPETTTTVIEPILLSTSTQTTAQNVFKGSAAMTTILGLYLVWRFFRTLI